LIFFRKKSGLFHQQRTDDNAFYFLYDAFDNASSKSPHVVIPVGRRLPAEMIELHLSMWIDRSFDWNMACFFNA
jgi:hypothetical protein